ncbi:Ff.00g039160.m01.CDS01 [Fusarium sp. VM40]|nr:Ff.00g039160.m01.CDS01 [Fusarium sp. VM40]
MSQGVECEYKDAQQPKIDPSTRLLLERIQLLEDKLFSSPVFTAPQAVAAPQVTVPVEHRRASSPSPAFQAETNPRIEEDAARPWAPDARTSEMSYPSSHTANANHVLNWPVVQQLLASAHEPGDTLLTTQSNQDDQFHAATDVFFHSRSVLHNGWFDQPADSWRLFSDESLVNLFDFTVCKELVLSFFNDVNVFFPLLSIVQVMDHLGHIFEAEQSRGELRASDLSPTQYCLLLLVLCLGSFVRRGGAQVRWSGYHNQFSAAPDTSLCTPDQHLWRKAQLLLGHVTTHVSVEAAQCTMLARSYADHCQSEPYSEAFRRLYWVALIYECDFISEISVALPSGITRYEDLIPYPTEAIPTSKESHHTTPDFEHYSSCGHQGEELAAFQVSTNAAIRRLLNRVHSIAYDSKDHFRMTRVEYVKWLLRVSEDLWAYHDTIFRNLPIFLLVSQPPLDGRAFVTDHSPGSPRSGGLWNNPWNILRLQGRYYAAQHIIFRPFFDYLLLNMDHIETHPDKDAILQKCGLCLEGCKGFFSVFNVEEVNSVTCLFATGMA